MKKAIIVFFFIASFSSLKASAQTTAVADTKTQFSIADSAAFTGKYKYEGLPFEYIEVSVKEGKLYFVGGEYNGFLVPKAGAKDTFDVNDVAVFTFKRNPENKIIELKVDYEGQTFEGKKEIK